MSEREDFYWTKRLGAGFVSVVTLILFLFIVGIWAASGKAALTAVVLFVPAIALGIGTFLAMDEEV